MEKVGDSPVNSQSISRQEERKSWGLACNYHLPADPNFGLRILLGETQTDLASALKEWFLLSRHTVQLEGDGRRILERLHFDPFDVIIMEIALLGLDGIGVTSGFRAAGGNTPIILIAGRHCSNELKAGLDAGADACIVKPFRLGTRNPDSLETLWLPLRAGTTGKNGTGC